MDFSSLSAQVDEHVITRLGMSRAKNKVLGTGYIAGLKALVKVLNIPKPTVLTGKDSSIKLCESIANFGLKNTLIVTDKPLYDLGVLDVMLKTLDKMGAKYTLFLDVEPDPTFSVVEKGLVAYRSSNCDSVLAVGGGSSIDAAKVIALAASNGVDPKKLVGILKGKKASAPFFCVPTTAGTGSEVTIGAVISDTTTHSKEIVIDTKVVPLMAALDPVLMKGLPPAITAATGMDALTHLVESFLSTLANEESNYYSKAGIKLVFENLPKAFKTGSNVAARENMALASFYGGLTINLAGLGYVHAFAHQLGARYRIPHGLANAKVLPHVLAFNKEHASSQLAELAELIGVVKPGSTELENAQAFIDAVKSLIQGLNIDASVRDLQLKDFPEIRQAAFKEANSTYAVPAYMSAAEADALLLSVSKGVL
jgi:alcohol dehydrogenase class IV